MALVTSLIDEGLHHALAVGDIIAGAGFGEVAGPGAGVLMRLLLPFSEEVFDKVGFEEQFYTTFQSLDGNVSAVSMDVTEFETDPSTGQQIIRFRLDVGALPATVDILLESHHSEGR